MTVVLLYDWFISNALPSRPSTINIRNFPMGGPFCLTPLEAKSRPIALSQIRWILLIYHRLYINLCGFGEFSTIAMEMDQRVDFFPKLANFNKPPDTRETRK